MKRSLITFAAVLATVFTFVQCKKDDAMHRTYFWTNVSNEKLPLTLFVDGQVVGTLPAFNSQPTCGNDTLKQQALMLDLKSGKYHLQAKDSLGNVKSGSILKMSDSGMGGSSSKGEAGGMAVTGDGNSNGCVIVNLFY